MKDPEPYLLEQRIALPCPVHPDRPAVISTELRERLNWEVFYFSDAEARKAFHKDPLHWCGLLTDPVDGMRFQPTTESPRAEYDGRLYYFSSNDHRTEFLKMPGRYADRMGM